jgi:hypothetical protein
MQILTVNICYVKGNEFIPLVNGIDLKFSNETGTFPEPTQKELDKAFEEQYPDLEAKVPIRISLERSGVQFKGRYGLQYSIINRKKT